MLDSEAEGREDGLHLGRRRAFLFLLDPSHHQLSFVRSAVEWRDPGFQHASRLELYNHTSGEYTNGRIIPYVRGFVLGGCSSVNDMAYTRGSKDDYDRYANVTGDEGWSWDSLIPYIRKNERLGPPADHHNTNGQFNPAVHGFDGINSVTLSGFPSPIDPRVIGTAKASSEWPFNLDMNSGYHLGVGWMQETVRDGSRSSSATSYLAQEFISRPNLHVLLHAQVTRVLPSGLNSTFRTVEFVQNRQGLPGGTCAFGGKYWYPEHTMHSGIGNSSMLSSLGIQPLHNLPSVGQNLSDHPIVGVGFLVKSTDTYETAERNATLAAEQLAEWTATRSGPLRFLRLPDNASIFERFLDPAVGPNTPHYELGFVNGLLGPPPPTGNFLGGSVTLNSSDPLSDPLIDLNFFGSEVDFFIMREAIRSALRFAFQPHTSTDAELDEYTRINASPFYHAAGTASMSPKGLTGLRIVDLSVVPFIPTGLTQAPTYIIAERAADIIKKDWNYSPNHSVSTVAT
ncbi:aryl-alcohol-oxidase from pleurotus Eryingii [Mycena galericulata]|nr:aryl-alcohol-oxidase from pleurotus Eryingii [Mycena galericulata]